ncbi:MAG: hypothetical protein Kow0075_16530 [Salibacteraceae bacterium]
MLRLKENVSRSRVSEFKLSTLLEITNAINNNLPEDQLFVLFQYILQHQLSIGKAVVFLKQDDQWQSVLHYGVNESELQINVERDLKSISDITVLEMSGKDKSKSFDVVIPVQHQSEIIAYLLLGDIDEQELKASPIIKHLPFIQTLANITAVAVENKRLVRESIKQERLNRELQLASEMQGLLLPESLPNNKKIQVAATYRPHQQVGGDYYDVIEVSDDEVMFCMADVSGKGISAAILMANFQANLHANVQVGRTLEDIVQTLNDRIWKSARGERFITLFLARYKYSTRTMHYINAAHPPAKVFDGNQCISLADGCVGLGMFETLPFIKIGKLKVPPKSVFTCYTDGLSELENEKGELFDDKQIEAILRSNPDMDMEEFNRLVFQALDRHRGSLDFQDDIALISCRFL